MSVPITINEHQAADLRRLRDDMEQDIRACKLFRVGNVGAVLEQHTARLTVLLRSIGIEPDDQTAKNQWVGLEEFGC